MKNTPLDRLMARVCKDPDTGCWVWTGPIFETGYGHMAVNGKGVGVHRLAYLLLVGPIPEGLQIDHLCRNRACVNPQHMEPVTIRENLLRGETKAAENAAKTHCPRGHEYSPENTYITRKGGRTCRECQRIHGRAYLERIGPERRAKKNAQRNQDRDPDKQPAYKWPDAAHKTHCKHGHEFTPENTINIKTGRACRTCQRAANAAYKKRKRESG